MFSKDSITKPSIYIATDYNGTDLYSNLDIATSIENNPFIDAIFTVEGIYDLTKLKRLSGPYLDDLGMIMKSELDLADMIIADLRAGDPVELGYAVANEKPIILFNPDKKTVNPLVNKLTVATASTLDSLSDLNYLKLFMNNL